MEPKLLPDTPRYSWDEPPMDGLPISLAERLTWTSDVSPDRSQVRSGKTRPPQRQRRADDAGLDIMDAHSAADALELLHILRFDMVIVGEDRLGEAVPALLKRIQLVSPGTRCIVVSSRMDERRERAIRQAGAMAILEAPLPFARLRDVVGHVAAGR